MAILLYSLAGLGLIAGGIWGFSAGIEWWAGLILIGFGLGCIAIALYKLDEETNCFANAKARQKARKVQKIADGKYRKTPLDMVPMMIRAYDERKENGAAHIQKKALKCIVSGYKTMWKNWQFVAKERPDLMDNLSTDRAEHLLFTAVSRFITVFIAIDDDISAEYDVYCKFCKRVAKGTAPLSKTELKKEYDRLIEKDENGNFPILSSATFIRNICRGCIPSHIYEKFVMGFCYLALADNSVYEDEYLLLANIFFDSSLDRYPQTWEQFKKEY